MNELLAGKLLLQCRGDEIWSVETCRREGIPEAWIDDLRDCFESGFRFDRQTIYEKGQVINHYDGCRDLDLAFKLAEFVGIDTTRFRSMVNTPQRIVQLLQEEYEEA